MEKSVEYLAEPQENSEFIQCRNGFGAFERGLTNLVFQWFKMAIVPHRKQNERPNRRSFTARSRLSVLPRRSLHFSRLALSGTEKWAWKHFLTGQDFVVFQTER